MIDITKLTEADKGRAVTYSSFRRREFGRITSWNDKFIFVRYHLVKWDNGNEFVRTGDTSEATDPFDLAWDHPQVEDNK